MAARRKPTAQQPQAEKPPDVDDALTQLRKQFVTRAREKLRVKVLPELEAAINMVPSGRTRNRLTEANILLLQALEELQA